MESSSGLERAGGRVARVGDGTRQLRRPLLVTTVLASLATWPATADQAPTDGQVAQARTTQRFDIPAQPLIPALIAFTDATGIQLFFDSALARDLRSPGVSGMLAPEDALRRLLTGSGLAYRFTNPTTVTLEKPTQTVGDGAFVLSPVTVEGQGETATGPIDGYVATRNATGTKTDTPIIETPQSISVVTRDRMDAQKVDSMADVLRYTPGVSGEAFGVDTRSFGLNIRGFGASDTGFYRDGLPVKVTDFASPPLDPYGAERVEVLRGPTSVLYGQSEPGGLVNYVAKRPPAEAFGEVELGIGNLDRTQGAFDIGGPATADGTVLYRFTGLARDADTQVDYVDQDRVFFAPSVTWQPNRDTSLTILSHYQRDETGWAIQFLPAAGTVLPNPNGTIPSSRFTGEPSFDNYDVEQYALGYQFEHRFTDAWTFRQNARYSHLHNEQVGVFSAGLQDDQRTLNRYADEGVSTLDGIAVDNQGQAKFTTGPAAHTLLVGLDFQYNTFSDWGTYAEVGSIDAYNPVYGTPIPSLPVYKDTDIDQQQLGLYLQDQVKLADKWVVVLGGRHDWAKTDAEDHATGASSEKTDTAFTWRAGLVYLSDTGLAPYASYTESFLPVLGSDASGQAFDPETGQQYEIGIKYQPPGRDSFVAVAAFELTRQNTTTTDPSNPLNQVQTGEVRSRGIEVEAVASLGFGVDLVAAYTYLDTEITKNNDGNEGNRPYAVPEHRASLWADYTIQDGSLAGLGVGAGVRYIGETYGDDANTFTVPGYTLFDGAIHYDWRDFRFGLNATNIFDEEHVASCFSAVAGCNYGEGRTILGTVRYRW